MSQPIIEAMFYGTINAGERSPARHSGNAEAERRLGAEKAIFTEKLSPDDRQHFGELENLCLKVMGNTEADSFSYGFTLGARIILEVLTERGNIAGRDSL